MKSKYIDLQTGEVINAKQLLAWEQDKDRIWEVADELRSLLADIAEAKKEEARGLLMEVAVIEDMLKKYDIAEETLDIYATESIKTPHRTV